MLNFKRMGVPMDVILGRIRWYAAYPLSYLHLEEVMQERGVSVDHSSINRLGNSFHAAHREDGVETQTPSRQQLAHG